jgi:hypothetical protein
MIRKQVVNGISHGCSIDFENLEDLKVYLKEEGVKSVSLIYLTYWQEGQFTHIGGLKPDELTNEHFEWLISKHEGVSKFLWTFIPRNRKRKSNYQKEGDMFRLYKKANFSGKLKNQLIKLGEMYATKHNLKCFLRKSALIFEDNKNLLPASYTCIENNWKKRLEKTHSHFEKKLNIRELDSSNSSDALLMNIFCHPELNKWKSIKKLFNLSDTKGIIPDFGYKPGVNKNGGKPDDTEIDMKLDNIYIEAKLTESDFTKKEKSIVESYDNFGEVFERDYLEHYSNKYLNYQLIRNILAAYQDKYNFILLCDARRPDLIREFYLTVRCIKDVSLRSRCNIVLWQEVCKCVGGDLKPFLIEKYGL